MKRFFFFVFSLTFFTSCVKSKHRNPVPEKDTIQLWSIRSIADFKAVLGTSGVLKIQEAVAIRGWVTAHDKSGNLYKQIIIDDGTAAIPILLDGYNLYAEFPIGMEVQVLCRNLTAGVSSKLPLLGYAADSQGILLPIPKQLFPTYIRKGVIGAVQKPITVLLREVKKALPELYSRRVLLDSVQFLDSGLLCYAVPPNLASASNLSICDGDGNIIALRTSAFADFASCRPPSGSGSVRAIYSVYNSTPQLILLDTIDVHFNQKRFP